MGGLDSLDWSAIRFETKRIESELEEWLINGEVKYLQEWSFAFAEKKAKYVGLSLNSKEYMQLQTMTRSRVFNNFYGDFQDVMKKGCKDLKGLRCKLVRYEDIDRLIEKDMERLTRPKESPLKHIDPEQEFNNEISTFSSFIERGLSEYISQEEIELLRSACFDYAEDKARQLKLPRGSAEYKRLHVAVKYELMSEVEEFVLGFSDGDVDRCSELAHSFLEHNDLDFVFKEFRVKSNSKF